MKSLQQTILESLTEEKYIKVNKQEAEELLMVSDRVAINKKYFDGAKKLLSKGFGNASINANVIQFSDSNKAEEFVNLLNKKGVSNKYIAFVDKNNRNLVKSLNKE